LDDDEIRQVLKELGRDVNAEELEALMNILDENGDGHVTLDEFVDGCAKFQNLLNLFIPGKLKIFDRNLKGEKMVVENFFRSRYTDWKVRRAGHKTFYINRSDQCASETKIECPPNI
jgi:hypothetical protein